MTLKDRGAKKPDKFTTDLSYRELHHYGDTDSVYCTTKARKVKKGELALKLI